MRLKIGKLLILVAWGNPYEVLKKDCEEIHQKHELIKRIKEVMNEPPYVEEVRAYLRQGHRLEAVKVCLRERMNGLRDAKDEAERIESKMIIDAKSK